MASAFSPAPSQEVVCSPNTPQIPTQASRTALSNPTQPAEATYPLLSAILGGMAREKLKEALLKHHTAQNLPAPIGTALDEAADNPLVALYELLVEEERRQGGNDGTDTQRDSVHPNTA